MSEKTFPDLTAYNAAIANKDVLLPDGESVKIKHQDISARFDGDAWCDEYDVIIEPDYEHNLACFYNTLVNAGHCRTSGTHRFSFVLENVSLKRAAGDLFDWKRVFIDREIPAKNWREEQTICDAFSAYPRRCMNRLKERVEKPRQEVLQQSKDDNLLWRICYLGVARKIFLARAGYPEFRKRLES
ncbi:MAG: hypothetical protein NXH97_22340 [Rhodobacteraceae bacterium]|nr:hypothetical protein [Paracoccaceae bacterium]